MPIIWTRPKLSLRSFCSSWQPCRPYTSLSAHGNAVSLRSPSKGSAFARCRGLTTLFYSTVIAAASTLDVNAKSNRREKWDEAISKLENELAVGRNHSQEASQPRNASDRPKILFDSNPDSPLVGRISSEVLGNLENPTKMDWQFEHASLSPHSIYALGERRATSSATPTALVRMEYSVAKLAASMLGQVDAMVSSGKSCALQDSITEIDKYLQELSQRPFLDLEGIRRMQSPRYTSIHEENAAQATRSLSNSLLKLLKKHWQGRMSLEDTVRKISHNLLVSPAPPDQRTFTILVERFVKLRQFGLAQAAVDAIFDSKIRPDEMTISTLITYHRHSRDRRGFTVFCRKLNGHLKGLAEENPALTIGGTNSRRVHRDESSGKNIQKVQFDPAIHRNLIATNLSFSRLRESLSAWRNMRGRGVEPTLDVLKDYMRFFAQCGDWHRGIRTWEQIHKRFIIPNTNVKSDRKEKKKKAQTAFDSLAAYAYYYALENCKKNFRSKEFASIYSDGLSRGYTMDALLLRPRWADRIRFDGSRNKGLERKVNFLTRRAELHELDFKRWSMHALAAKLVLAGSSYEQVADVLNNNRDDSCTSWFRKGVTTQDDSRPPVSNREVVKRNLKNMKRNEPVAETKADGPRSTPAIDSIPLKRSVGGVEVLA